MPWSRKENGTTEWIDVDPKERFYLAADWRVWDSKEDVWYDHSYFDENANNIDYWDWQWSNKAVFWTPKKLYVAYDWEGNWKTISILTDRLIYNIYSDWVHVAWWVTFVSNCSDNTWTSTYRTRIKIENSDTFYFNVVLSWESCCRAKFRLTSQWANYNEVNISAYMSNIKWIERTKSFDPEYSSRWEQIVNETWLTLTSDTDYEIEFYADNYLDSSVFWRYCWLWFEGKSSSPTSFVDIRCFKKEDWQYLYPKDRNIIDIEDESYVEVDSTEYEMLYYDPLEDMDGVTYYQLTQWNSIDFPDWYDVRAFARSFDYMYEFVNKWDMWIVYLATDANLAAWDSWWRFPWTKFVNAILIWNYAYVIAEKRWVRWLYVFYNWDMKLLSWADKRYTEWDSLINGKEIYNFTWIMCNWRDHIVCATKDSVFMWWANKLWQNVWAFILKVDWEITDINTKRWYLDVYYTKDNVNYRQTIQDDVNIVNYESEFSVTYPIQINSHYIEKEPLNLMVSHMLPNIVTTIKAYISVNDNYFWSFLTDWEVTPEEWEKFRMNWCWWDYWLTFVEKNWNWLTFTMSGDLPYQINNTKELISEGTNTTIEYSDFSHFKFIWEITKESPKEVDWKSVLLSLSQKNDLPTVRKAQVKLVWTTDWYTTPEIYDVRLLSNQFDK